MSNFTGSDDGTLASHSSVVTAVPTAPTISTAQPTLSCLSNSPRPRGEAQAQTEVGVRLLGAGGSTSSLSTRVSSGTWDLGLGVGPPLKSSIEPSCSLLRREPVTKDTGPGSRFA